MWHLFHWGPWAAALKALALIWHCVTYYTLKTVIIERDTFGSRELYHMFKWVTQTFLQDFIFKKATYSKKHSKGDIQQLFSLKETGLFSPKSTFSFLFVTFERQFHFKLI